MKLQKINTKKALSLINKYGKAGELFSVVFKRRSKEKLFNRLSKISNPDPALLKDAKDIWRTMTCRLGVKKNVKGIGLSYDPKNYNLLPVYDIGLARAQKLCPYYLEPKQLNGLPFRMIPIENIVFLKIHKRKYLVVWPYPWLKASVRSQGHSYKQRGGLIIW